MTALLVMMSGQRQRFRFPGAFSLPDQQLLQGKLPAFLVLPPAKLAPQLIRLEVVFPRFLQVCDFQIMGIQFTTECFHTQ